MVQISQHLRFTFSHLYISCKDQNEIIYLKGHYKLYISRRVRECCCYQIIGKVAHSRAVILRGSRKDSVLNFFFLRGGAETSQFKSHSFGLNIVLSKILLKYK